MWHTVSGQLLEVLCIDTKHGIGRHELVVGTDRTGALINLRKAAPC